MTPAELYNSIKQQMTIADTSICQLHKPCTATPACTQPQNHPMLDFDEVEKRWHQQKGMESTASVDALSHTEGTLCMIEIKGWKMFLKHQPIAQQLNMLASTSSNWETICTQHLSKRFQQQTAGMNNIRSYFIYCKQLDSLLTKL